MNGSESGPLVPDREDSKLRVCNTSVSSQIASHPTMLRDHNRICSPDPTTSIQPSSKALSTTSVQPDSQSNLPTTHSSKVQKKSRSGFKLPRTKKDKKDKIKSAHIAENQATSSTTKPKSDHLAQPVPRHEIRPVSDPSDSNICKISKQEVKTKKIKKSVVLNESQKDDASAVCLGKPHRNSPKSKKSRLNLRTPKARTEQSKVPTKPVFGVPLELACERDPSHDGVLLPAFFRHCIDYIEEYGLSTEGIYRVPGIHSQVQTIVNSLDNGEDFTNLVPTSAALYNDQELRKRSSYRVISGYTTTGPESSSKLKTRNLSGANLNSKDINCTPSNRTQIGLSTSAIGAGCSRSRIGSPLPPLLSSDQRATTDGVSPRPPHDPAVVASVVKQFLRNLPEPVLTKRLTIVMESLSTNDAQVYHCLATLVHQELPRPNRFLLAWIIQHMMHIIDKVGENLMTLANISIVMSPCLGISHRLLAVLLSPPPPDLEFQLSRLDPSLPPVNKNEIQVDPSVWHWLFPHPVYLLRPYRPPLRPTPYLELPETGPELDLELKKQESLLAHLHAQIKRGETTPEKETLLWEVQRLVTEIKRQKSLTDPEAVRAELVRLEAQLERLHRAISDRGVDSSMGQSHDSGNPDIDMTPPQFADFGRRRIPDTTKTKARCPVHTTADSIVPHSDELWEVQRQITMHKRRLKQLEKLSDATNLLTQPSISNKAGYSIVMSGASLFIPSLSELDQEEVLNLTLRKLPVDTTSTTDNSQPTIHSQDARTQPNPPCSDLSQTAAQTSDADNSKLASEQIPTDECHASSNDHHASIKSQPDEPILSSNNKQEPEFISDTALNIQEPEQLETTGSLPTQSEEAATTISPKTTQTQPTELTTPVNLIKPAPSPDLDELNQLAAIESLDSTFEPKFVPTPSPVINPPTQPPPPVPEIDLSMVIDPAQRQLVHQFAFYSACKQELMAIQTDLRARIWSENAEISRLKSCINTLLETGGKRVKRMYNAQVAARQLCPSWLYDNQISVPESNDVDKGSSWSDQPWTRLAEYLNDDPNMSRDSDSDQAPTDDHMLGTNESFDLSSYARLNEEETEGKQSDNSSEQGTLLDVLNHSGPSKIRDETMVNRNGETRDDDEEEDEEEEDEEECEAELARTLHQLTLDNARLEQLNKRCLEEIQAERNRCAELKVLLRIRNNAGAPLGSNIQPQQTNEFVHSRQPLGIVG